MDSSDFVDPSSSSRDAFHTTRWSIVIAAQKKSSSEDATHSLEALCRQYWSPLYAFIRRRGFSPHDAQDLTQEFFSRLLEKDWLAVVMPENGRFRAFLLMALKRFLLNEWDHSTAQKRGGGKRLISLDAETAESFLASKAMATMPAEATTTTANEAAYPGRSLEHRALHLRRATVCS